MKNLVCLKKCLYLQLLFYNLPVISVCAVLSVIMFVLKFLWCRFYLRIDALFPFVITTIAPTVIQGSSRACNVMPQDMQAVINLRLADGDTVENVMAHCRAAVQDPTVELRYQQANDPSATARRDGYGYRTVVDSMQRYYPDVVFVPSMTVGATDAHQYEQICDTCLRCSPFMAEPEEAASGVHGTNERILVRAYLQGIRVLIDLMEHANL